MNILICPSGFKESLEPHLAADCIEEGILRVVPDAVIQKAPLFDGGEGFARAIVAATDGELRYLTVTGVVGKPIRSHYGFLGCLGGCQSRTAVIEMAAVAGLSLVPKDSRDPSLTTTYGIGEMIGAAIDEGAERILVGCGDSGTSDGGVGMCQALGARFLDATGNEIPHASGGRMLSNITDIDLSCLDPSLKDVKIEVACNWHNVLCGPNGVARVYGPQKGATTPEQVETLAMALDNYGSVVTRKLGIDISQTPGSGASGGLGTGLILVGAKLRPRYEVMTEYLNLDRLLDECQLVFTAEGGIDFQTPLGKIPAEIALQAKKHGLPVIALAGTIGIDAEANYEAGIDAFASILQGPTTLENAIKEVERLLKDSAESAMRMVMVGRSLRETY